MNVTISVEISFGKYTRYDDPRRANRELSIEIPDGPTDTDVLKIAADGFAAAIVALLKDSANEYSDNVIAYDKEQVTCHSIE